VVGLLEENGIAAHIEGEQLAAAHGALPFTEGTSPSVVVDNDADLSRARELIARHDVGVNPKFCGQCGYDLRGLPQARCPECGAEFRRTHMWRCADCGEVSEVQFTHCWHCSQPRGEAAELPPEHMEAQKSKKSQWLMPPTPCLKCHGTGYVYRPILIFISIVSGLFSVLLLFQFLVAMHHARFAAPLYSKILYAPLVFICFFIAFRHRHKPCDCVRDGGSE
jgi:hypothetical protein